MLLAYGEQFERLDDIVAKPMVILPLYLPSLVFTLLGEALGQMPAHQLLAIAP